MAPSYPLCDRFVMIRMAIHDNHFIHYTTVTMAVSIDFTWQKDASGYRLVKKGSLPGNKPTIDTIMPNGGPRILIHPMAVPDIYRIFANIKSADGMLGFVQSYGLLGHYENKKSKGTYLYRDPIDGSHSVKRFEYEGMPV